MMETALAQAPAAPAVALLPCCHCGRTFLPARLAKHQAVCTERRKQPIRHVKNSPSRRIVGGAQQRTSVWRRQHAEFQAMVRANRLRHQQHQSGGTSSSTRSRIRPWSAAPSASRHGSAVGLSSSPRRAVRQPRITYSIDASANGREDSDAVGTLRRDGSKVGRSPARRPDAAQRHALEWLAREAHSQRIEDYARRPHIISRPSQLSMPSCGLLAASRSGIERGRLEHTPSATTQPLPRTWGASSTAASPAARNGHAPPPSLAAAMSGANRTRTASSRPTQTGGCRYDGTSSSTSLRVLVPPHAHAHGYAAAYAPRAGISTSPIMRMCHQRPLTTPSLLPRN